jgi:hypothetical protein
MPIFLMSLSLILGFIFLVLALLGCLAYFLYGWPPSLTKDKWSIGIYAGVSPLDLYPTKQIKNPVLTAQDVTDIDAGFIADPFIIKVDSNWYLFFEAFNNVTQKGEIGYAVSKDSFHWEYQQIVLSESFHLSYPQVFRWKNDYYMIPESYEAKSVRLYKANKFPGEWQYEKTLLEKVAVDASIFFHFNKWWMFTSNPIHNNLLNLYYADELYGPWLEHPRNPLIINNNRIARPGGRITFFDGKIIRFAQDDWLVYGNKVRAFEIIKLTETEYEEKLIGQKPVISRTGSGWNRYGMHHLDPLQIDNNLWIAAVDGFGKGRVDTHI